jgi:hypothetical protein
MIRLHYSDVARAIASAKTTDELETAVRITSAYYSTSPSEPTSERIRLLRQALESNSKAGLPVREDLPGQIQRGD